MADNSRFDHDLVLAHKFPEVCLLSFPMISPQGFQLNLICYLVAYIPGGLADNIYIHRKVEREMSWHIQSHPLFLGGFFFIEFRRENFYLFFEQRCSGLCLGCRSLWSECDWFRWAEICLSWKWAAICSGKFKIFSLNGSFFILRWNYLIKRGEFTVLYLDL